MSQHTHLAIANRIRRAGAKFAANDNISRFINPGDMPDIEAEVEHRVKSLLDVLVIDWANDHNTEGTARRVAKMFCREVFRGRYEPPPALTSFPNAKQLDEIMVIGPITVRSTCSHHFCPIIGKAWVAVLPGKRVVGLSKFNRIVEWFCSRPQIQEELVVQLADYLEKITKPKGLAVVMQATHTCMTWRGVKETGDCAMTGSVMRGVFRKNPTARAEVMALIKL